MRRLANRRGIGVEIRGMAGSFPGLLRNTIQEEGTSDPR